MNVRTYTGIQLRNAESLIPYADKFSISAPHLAILFLDGICLKTTTEGNLNSSRIIIARMYCPTYCSLGERGCGALYDGTQDTQTTIDIDSYIQ